MTGVSTEFPRRGWHRAPRRVSTEYLLRREHHIPHNQLPLDAGRNDGPQEQTLESA